MAATGLRVYVILFICASVFSSVFCNNNRRSEGGKSGNAETPFWAARGKRGDLNGGVIRCGIVKPGVFEAESDLPSSWVGIESANDGLDEIATRLKRSSGLIHSKGDTVLEPLPLWLSRASLELDRPGYQQFFYPSTHNNERILSLWKQLAEKRTDRSGTEKAGNGESAPFWAARG